MTSPEESKKIHCGRFDAYCPHAISTEKTCFIMMAYEQFHSSIIEKMLKVAVIKALKLKPILAKNLKKPGSTEMFCTRVCKSIMTSTNCIADVTYNNTNVGIEYGTAQGFNKPVIVTQYIPDKKIKTTKKEDKKIIERLEKIGLLQYSILPLKIPSDLSGMFYIRYNSQEDLIKQLKEQMDVQY